LRSVSAPLYGWRYYQQIRDKNYIGYTISEHFTIQTRENYKETEMGFAINLEE
jgi:hypothetical protein